MKFSSLRKYCLSLPGVTEEPHHHFSSFRVMGRIFVTAPPGQQFVHVFIQEQLREQAVGMYPGFVEKLFWGGRVVGVRILLAQATATVVKSLVRCAWEGKAPKALLTAGQGKGQ